ncbi:MAG: imelysin family protein [Verrucomicrobiota bacterium]
MKSKTVLVTLTLAGLSLLSSCEKAGDPKTSESGADTGSLEKQVAENYAAIVYANYSDSLKEATKMAKTINDFLTKPSAEAFESAKEAWTAARLPYLQTEAFRFYEGPIDDEDGPEGLLNAWPMDESYLDYVAGALDAGLINKPDKFPKIDAALIEELNEKDGEENISSGYHAIEFLLWGQDQSADGPGKRPFTDYTTAANADRRGAALKATTDLLLQNLTHLVEEWAPDNEENYRAEFLADPNEATRRILAGIAMLSAFEMASERLLVAYDSKLQEDEHSCFSDTTHNDVVYDLLGIKNVWEGTYTTLTGEKVEGPGFVALVEAKDPEMAKRISGFVSESYELGKKIPVPFDQAILGDDSAPGRVAILKTIESLEEQGELLQKAGKLLGHEVAISE